MEQLGQEGVDSNQRRVVIISQESFYRELHEVEAQDAKVGNFNFDHPGELDQSLWCIRWWFNFSLPKCFLVQVTYIIIVIFHSIYLKGYNQAGKGHMTSTK